MFVSLQKYARSELNLDQQSFLEKTAPLAKLIQDWTKLKAEFWGIKSPYGIFACLILAFILHESNWGKHPMAQKKNGAHLANNLMLIRATKDWEGDVITHNGIDYKSYENWRDFATDASDVYVFSGLYSKALQSQDWINQLSFCSSPIGSQKDYNEIITTLIEKYGLTEFDRW